MDKQRLTPCLLTVQHVRSGDSQELTWHRKASPPSSPGPSSTLGPLYPFGTTPGAGRPAARARQADGDEAALLPRRSNQRGRPRTSEQTSSQGVQTQTQTREDQGGTEGTGAEMVGEFWIDFNLATALTDKARMDILVCNIGLLSKVFFLTS